MNIFKQFMFHNRHQIYSIYVNFTLNDSYCFSWFFFDPSFDRLESISFRIIQSDTLIPILRNLSSLSRLFSLTIETSNVKEEINDIYRLTFIVSKLKYYRILSFNNHYPITLRTCYGLPLSLYLRSLYFFSFLFFSFLFFLLGYHT